MVFSSIVFLFLFLPTTILIHYFIRKELKNAILLVVSILFYTWGEPRFVGIMLVSLLANYLFGLAIDYFQNKEMKIIYSRVVIALCVILNIGLLGYFKYCNFFVDNLNVVLQLFGAEAVMIAKITLPIGISFYTFHELSYVIDVYRKDAKAQKNFFNLALYILFFPQLIAGPIIRYHDVSEQLTDRKIDIDGFSYGLRKFITGVGKKVIIANTMGSTADFIFSLPSGQLSFALSWIGIISYTLQIYFDFSGYSDMAIGLARMFGFKFPENFNYPYISKSITEFWRRWHISLSTWFRDYLYIPLGGNRKGQFNTYRNLIIVFLCTGIWHGASWNFLIWGIYYGIFLVLERTKIIRFSEKGSKIFGRAYLLAVVIIGWVFFRSDTIGYAIDYLKTMFLINRPQAYYGAEYFLNFRYIFVFVLAVIGSTPLFNKYFLQLENTGLKTWHAAVRDVFLMGVFLLSVIFLSSSTYNPFIYFRF